MRCGCWEEAGAHRILNDKVRAVQALIDAVYVFSCVGGNLHIVLDDDNLEDSSLDFCAAQIAAGGYRRPPAHIAMLGPHEADSPEQLAVEQACLEALRAMTMEERISALGLWNKYWSTTIEA